MPVVSYLQLNHPALGTAGGAGLHASIEAIYSKIGDNIGDRLMVALNLNNAATVELEHNFNTPFAELRWDLYLYDEVTTALTRVTATSSPSLADFAIVANGGDPTGKIDVTNNSGAQRDLALVVFRDPIYLSEGDIKDVDISTAAPQDGQALVWEASSSKFKPGASGDASFKLQSVSTPNAVIKGGYLLIDDGRELATYDGSGSASTDFGTDLTVSLTTIFGGAPANATAYYLYIDLQTLGSQVTLTDDGRRVYGVQQANLHLSTTPPMVEGSPTTGKDPRRYVPLAVIRSADAGNVWSGTGSAFRTLAVRRHETLTRFFAYPETFVDESITTAAALNTLNHNLSGEPHALYLTYDDGSTEIGLDLSAHLLDVTASQIKVSSLGLTFGGGQKLRVRAVRFPQQSAIASSSRQFTSQWFTSTATTTLPHGLNDFDDIKGYAVEEWDVTAGRYRLIDPSSLIVNFDSTNFYLNWTGLSPSSTLQYRVIAGGSPNPYSIPLEYGGFTKFVGYGPGSYATLTAAIAAAAAGDSILVMRDTTEPAGDLSIGVADLRVVCKPGAKVALSGALTNGLRLTAARVRLERFACSFAPSGAQARGISIEAADCWVEGRIDYATAQTLTDAVHITSGGSRAYATIGINRTAGTITNLLTNNDGASNVSVWGG